MNHSLPLAERLQYRHRPRVWRYVSDSEPPTPPSLDYFDHELRPTRRPRKVTSTKSHRTDTLRLMYTMPLDVLFEIFGHLHPLDVLNLARTSHGLRAILMSRSSVSVWKSAFSNVRGLPFCPSDMSEPQYANLAFDEHCHFCLVTGVQDVFWACRVRCCKKCINKYFVTEFILEKACPDTKNVHRRDTMFPYIVYPKPGRNRPGRLLFFLPTAQMYVREIEDIKLSMDSDYETAMVKWRTEKRLEQAQRLMHAALCESWSTYWVYRRSREFNLVIIAFLLVLLIFLWHDKICGWLCV